jgi:uncharacterized protein
MNGHLATEPPLTAPASTGMAVVRASLMFLLLLMLSAGSLAAQARGEAPIADWRLLAGLDYTNGVMSDALRAVDGTRVRVPGFMVPLDDSARGVTEFILVPYYGACIHTPPPPPNQMVYVQMNGGRRVEVNLWDPIWIEGELHVTEIDSPYGAIGHQLAGISISPYRF